MVTILRLLQLLWSQYYDNGCELRKYYNYSLMLLQLQYCGCNICYGLQFKTLNPPTDGQKGNRGPPTDRQTQKMTADDNWSMLQY